MRKFFFVVFIIVCAILGEGFFLSSDLHAAQLTEKTIPLDPSLLPDMVVIDSLHHRAYITAHTAGGTPMPVTVLDTLHDTISDVLPVNTLRAIAVNSTTHRLYIGDTITNSIAIFNTDTNTQIGTISATTNVPVAIAINELTNRIYILSQTASGGRVTVLNGETGDSDSAEITIDDSPQSIAVDSLTNKIYVLTTGFSPKLLVLDGVTNASDASVSLTNSGVDLSVDVVLNKIYITSDTATTITVIDGKSNTQNSQLSLSNMVPCAHTVSVDPIAHKLYAACFNGMSIIDTNTDTVIQQVPLTGDLPITHAITAQYFSRDAVLNKIYIPLEETHQIAMVSVALPPKIDKVSQLFTDEGSKISFPVSFTDTAVGSWTVMADFGDGSAPQSVLFTTTHGTLAHQYTDNGVYTATISITNDSGAISSERTTVTVRNVSPTVGAITVSNNPTYVQNALRTTVSFSDPGIHDTHTAFWDWGDGLTSQGALNENEGSGIATGDHVYTKAGVYIISVIIKDKDSAATMNRLQYIAVGDNSVASEIVTSGTIQSTAGDYIADQNLTGIISFGTRASRLPHTNIITGSVEITMPFANIVFHATSIDSFLINGTSTNLHGEGVINHTGHYGFLLSMQDNSSLVHPNTIRLKIWEVASGVIVYDSQPYQADSVAPLTAIHGGPFLFHQ